MIESCFDGPIPFTSAAHFHSHDVLWQGQTKSNEGFLGPMEKGFPLVSEGDDAVVRALRTEHCFVTCDVVLMFFAVPKTTVNNYFLRNWNTKLAKFFTSFVCWGEPQRAPQLRVDLDFRHSRYYRKRGSASYIVREVHSVRERERYRERERERERRK